MALGPAANAVQQAYNHATAEGCQHVFQAEVAALIANCYDPLLDTVASLAAVVLELHGGDPAAALTATLCHADSLVALCHQCAPILLWCGDLLVAHYAGLSKGLLTVHPVSGTALQQAGAAQRHREHMVECVLPTFDAGCMFLDSVGPWLHTCDSAVAAAAPAVAATVQLVRLTVGLEEPWVWLEAAVNALVLLQGLTLPWDPVTKAEGQPEEQGDRRRPQQGPQQRQARPTDLTWFGVPDICVEAAAVACSALCASLEARWRAISGSGEQLPEAGSESRPHRMMSLGVVVEATAKFVARLLGSLTVGTPKLERLQSLLAAQEAAVRLSSWLMLLEPHVAEPPGVDQTKTRNRLAWSAELLLGSCAYAEMLAHWRGKVVLPSRGKTVSAHKWDSGSRNSMGSSNSTSTLSLIDDSGIAGSLASLAASAAKAMRLVAHSEAGEATMPYAMCLLETALQLEGALLPFLDGFSMLAASHSAALDGLPRAAVCRLGHFDASSMEDDLRTLGQIVSRLDAIPGLTGLQLQEKLVPAYCGIIKRLLGVPLAPVARPDVLASLRWAAAFTADLGCHWQRSAGLAVQAGLLHDVLAWAKFATSRSGKQSKYYLELRSLWGVVTAVAMALLRQVPAGAASDTALVRRLLDRQQKLPATKQQQLLSSPGFWQRASEDVLPQLEALAVVTAQAFRPNESVLRLRVARALATRVCANPGCLDLRGCSEARLRSQRCSGCGVAKYCCRECHVADFEVHAEVCQQLALEACPPTQS
ncbi:hypothetical protein N2152v2_010314 [Parachlorella kessleri]